METFVSKISGKEFPIHLKSAGKTIHHRLLQFVQQKNPDFRVEDSMSVTELNQFRELYITQLIKREIGQLSDLEKKVIHSIKEHTTLTDRLDEEDTENLTLGQRIADHVASFGGSWTFILSFLFFLLCWIVINAFILRNKAYDPYPFILLNLILSCIAALQAPIIMMSQNRQEEKDRVRSKKDYMINLKSELEIRNLHEKIDHIIRDQQEELLEIQRIQIEMMNDILSSLEKK